MNGTPSDERLSAWLDDELSLDERAQFEKLLAESPELRSELEELQQVSGLVKQLPRVSAPEELQPAVMQGIERETLLAGHDVAAADTRRSRVNPAFVATAALVLVAVVVVWMQNDQGDRIADNSDSEPREIVSFREVDKDGMAVRRQQDEATDVPPESRVEVEDQQQVIQIRRNDLNKAQIGDMIDGFVATGETLSVIRLTVIDRQSEVEALQVLLAREQIPSQGDSSAGSTDAGLIVVYVESNPEQLSRAIERMRQSLSFDSLEVSPAVEIAGLELDVQNELGVSIGDSSKIGQRTLTVKPGSKLETIVQSSGAAVGASPKETTDSDGRVRVIFVLVDAPAKEKPEDKATNRENGAA